ASLNRKLGLSLGHFRAELGERGLMGCRFEIAVCNLVVTVSYPGGATIAMIDGDDFWDSVKLNRCRKIIPERRLPGFELRSHDADGRARDHKLADLAGQASGIGVIARELGKARIDTREHHRFVFAFGREQHGWQRDGSCRNTAHLQKPASVEARAQ